MKLKQLIKAAIKEWQCVGYFGYGQGRAAATFGEGELGDVVVCHDICPKSDKCRQRHCKTMDEKYPIVANIVKRTLLEVKGQDISPVQAVVVAMTVSANRGEIEAMRIREGLKKYQVPILTDHYMYGQLDNLDNGLNKRNPEHIHPLVLIGSESNLSSKQDENEER